MKLTHRLLSLAVVATALFLVGCETTNYEGAMPGQQINAVDAPNATIHLNTVVILDRELQDVPGRISKRAGKIAIERHGGIRLATGAMEVYVTVRNRTDHPQQLEFRTHFFGSQQEPVEGPSAWQRVMLPPLGVSTYKSNSMAFNNVDYYYVEVREGR